MSKKIYILLGILALAALSACHDFRDDKMVADSVYLRSADDNLLQDYTIYDGTIRFGVIKAGKGLSTGRVEIGIATNDQLFQYNEDHETEFVALAKSHYNADEIDGKVLEFSQDEARLKVDVKWDPQDMVNLMTSETDNFVIPVCIRSSNLAISETKNLLLIHPVLTTLTVRDEDNSMTCKEESTFTAKVGVKLDNAIPGHDVKVKLSFNPAAMTVNGISYAAAPAGSITLVSDEVVINAGDIEADIEVDLDMSGVASGVNYIAGEIVIESASVVIDGGTDIDFIPVKTSKMTVRVTKTKKA